LREVAINRQTNKQTPQKNLLGGDNYTKQSKYKKLITDKQQNRPSL